MEALQEPSHVGRQSPHEGHRRTSGVHAQHSKKPSNLAQFLHFLIIVWCKYVNIQRHKKDVSSFFFCFFPFKATVGMFSGAENKNDRSNTDVWFVTVYIFWLSLKCTSFIVCFYATFPLDSPGWIFDNTFSLSVDQPEILY